MLNGLPRRSTLIVSALGCAMTVLDCNVVAAILPSIALAPHDVLTRLGDKWTILAMSHLAIGPSHRLRFSTLKNGIEGISQRMLTLTLRNLERDGLLVRHYFPEVPPRAEYELTPMGVDMLPALEGFTSWIAAHWPHIQEARRLFDEKVSESALD